MADLSLRLIADAAVNVGWVRRVGARCDNCGAAAERVCSYCGAEPMAPALLDGGYILSRRQVEAMRLPEPSDGKAREE